MLGTVKSLGRLTLYQTDTLCSQITAEDVVTA